MRVSLCLIVKDEIDYLEGCIESARSLVDDIVVVDTGSSDGTDRLAARFFWPSDAHIGRASPS